MNIGQAKGAVARGIMVLEELDVRASFWPSTEMEWCRVEEREGKFGVLLKDTQFLFSASGL